MTSATKERPIIFSAPMVRAIIEGRKTMTRRPVKLNESGRVARGGRQWHIDDPAAVQACPYGQPGDRLWVRETWAYYGGVEYLYQRCRGSVAYRAGGTDTPLIVEGLDPIPGGKWYSSIHMPRWASRITLEVTCVRVERLQDISEEEAIREGISSRRIGRGDARCGCQDVYGLDDDNHAFAVDARHAFQELWELINGAGSWDANPWVWVIEFKRVDEQSVAA